MTRTTKKRHIVDLENHKCSCREWQITGKSCKHALTWICSNRGVQISNYVHEYYSIAKFRVAYEQRVEPMPDRSQWPHFELGFKVFPPLLGRRPGRPKVVRIRGCLEKIVQRRKWNVEGVEILDTLPRHARNLRWDLMVRLLLHWIKSKTCTVFILYLSTK